MILGITAITLLNKFPQLIFGTEMLGAFSVAAAAFINIIYINFYIQSDSRTISRIFSLHSL
jgi:hypothetical protein